MVAPPTGFGADYIIVDDLTKAADADHAAMRAASVDYFRGSLVTRLNDAACGRIIVIGQRLHEEDVPGHCLESGIYRHLNLPAVAPGPALVRLGAGKVKKVQTSDLLYYPQEVLDRLRLEMGGPRFSAQYLQEPAATESQFIRWSRIHRYPELPERNRFLCVVQSWDVAQVENAAADYTVCTTWGFLDGKWLLMHLDRYRCDYGDLKGRVLATREVWEADVVLIEDAGCGKALISDLTFLRQTSRSTEYSWRLCGYQPKDSKPVRWAAQAAKLEQGFAMLPEEAPWLDDLRREVVAFPGRYDDQVDSIAQFLDWSRLRTGRSLLQEHNQRPVRREGPRHQPGPRAV